MDAATATLQSVSAVQSALNVLTALQLVSYRFPQPETLTNGAKYDYVIIGGGTAGSIVASRLTEDPECTVALIEAGGEPPMETVLPGIFTVTPEASYDFNFPTEQDNFSGQYLQDKIVKLSAGKLLGGSSSINHMMHIRGNRRDYQRWATAANDSSWNYDGLLEYFKRGERLEDTEILNTPSARLYGTKGELGFARQPSDDNTDIIKSFQELGYEYHVDINADYPTGVFEPMFAISDGVRQSGAESFLPKNRKNLHVFEQTTVTKILFDDDKNAIGVEALTSDNEILTVNAAKEVILAAGALKTPQLLMLSGVGPESELQIYDIPVISNLPVGKTLGDHFGVLVPIKLEASDSSPVSNPHKFPAPTSVAFKSLNPSEKNPDCEYINLRFPNDSAGMMQLCLVVFKYNIDICNQISNANVGHGMLFSVVFILQPSSLGTVSLQSSNPLDNPRINTGYYSDSTDLDLTASCLLDIPELVNTTFFKEIGSEIVDLDLEECNSLDRNSWDFWRCYGKAMSSTLWHPSGTARMGDVLDSKLRVKGVQKLRVVDAAAMPNVNSGKLMSAVIVLAEKAADLIKEDK